VIEEFVEDARYAGMDAAGGEKIVVRWA